MIALSLAFIFGVIALLIMVVTVSVRLGLLGIGNRLESASVSQVRLQPANDDLIKAIEALPERIAEELAKVVPKVATQPTSTTVQTVQFNFEQAETGRNKLSKKLMGATEWIVKNDPECKLSVRQVAQAAQVSIGTAQAAIKIVLEEKSI